MRADLPSNFPEFFKREFEKRLEKNSSYSLRAFARDLEMSPQKLSRILKGNLGLSAGAAEDAVKKLRLGQSEAEVFMNLVAASHGRSATEREIAQAKMGRIRNEPILETISDVDRNELLKWYFNPILLLVDLENFEPSADYIAKKIGIAADVASNAVKKLFEHGSLIISKTGAWQRSKNVFAVAVSKSNPEIRQFYKDYLHKAIESVDQEPYEDRALSVGLVSIGKDDISFIRDEMTTFRQKLIKQISERPTKSDRLYAISMQLFRVDKELN